jgi:hypothetical protein
VKSTTIPAPASTHTIETLHPRNGQPTSWCVDIDQAHTDPRPVIIIHGTALDETLSLADAKRIHAHLGNQIAAAEQAATR